MVLESAQKTERCRCRLKDAWKIAAARGDSKRLHVDDIQTEITTKSRRPSSTDDDARERECMIDDGLVSSLDWLIPVAPFAKYPNQILYQLFFHPETLRLKHELKPSWRSFPCKPRQFSRFSPLHPDSNTTTIQTTKTMPIMGASKTICIKIMLIEKGVLPLGK